ncbi:low temperature requirement protein A [Nocardia sp. CDC160]|uniref:low temperature requirement protein A n=1 Tax=Nocardia sp. CDC160 TaxID=3112166 RepID=UPI002DB88F12|nr:low temperature requirement protein A [Nocardia sp. CDC160]MEC3916441.1 low temperature requirement protein A [Nocardia sp. CDC160]
MAKETPESGSAETPGTQERHASWMELFFDLVAVAGIGQLTHLLHRGPSLGDFGLYVVLYLAFWMVWACMTLYGNIAGNNTRVGLMLGAMAGLGLMAAAVPGIPDRHATTFAAVYVLVRLGAERIWGEGKLVVDWPTAQLTLGVWPWIVSLWVGEPAKFWLWGAGLALDLYVLFAISGEKMLAEGRKRLRARIERIQRSPRFDPDRWNPDKVPTFEAVHAEPAHLGERLGLFVIIVLGEGVIGIIAALGGQSWTAVVVCLAFAAFVILAGLWALTLLFGFIPRLMTESDATAKEPWQRIMLTHCGVTGGLATLAAGLGLAMDHAHGHLSTGVGWALCGGAATYFAVVGVSGIRSGNVGWRWLLTWPLPCTALAVALGFAATHLTALPLVCAVAALVLWPLLWETWSAGKWRTGSGPDRPGRAAETDTAT